MKHTLLLTFFCYSLTVSAQSGVFIEPGIGLGATNVKASGRPDYYPFSYGTSKWMDHPYPVFSYNPSLLIGYKQTKWSLTTGICFLKTGYANDKVLLYTPGGTASNGKITEYYHHVVVPLIFSEQFKLGKHCFIRPGFGFALSYNTAAVEKFREVNTPSYSSYRYPESNTKIRLTDNDFDRTYFRVVGWEILRLQMGYVINERLSFIAGPEYQFMLSSFIKDNHNYEINRALTLKMGISWMLHHKKKPEQPAGKE